MLKNYLSAILFLYCAALFGQNDAPPKHELGITGLNYERNTETMHYPLALKLVPGIYYSRRISDLEWISRVSYGDNPIDDNCSGCADQFYGIGRLKEFNISTGYRYHLFQGKHYQLLPFVETGVYHTRVHYSGDFDGGFSGSGIVFNKKQWSTGFVGRLGLTYSPNGLLTLSASTSYRIGRGGISVESEKTITGYKTYNGSLLQFSAGYRL